MYAVSALSFCGFLLHIVKCITRLSYSIFSQDQTKHTIFCLFRRIGTYHFRINSLGVNLKSYESEIIEIGLTYKFN